MLHKRYQHGLLLFTIKLPQWMESAALLAEALLLPVCTPESTEVQVLPTHTIALIIILLSTQILSTPRDLHSVVTVCLSVRLSKITASCCSCHHHFMLVA